MEFGLIARDFADEERKHVWTLNGIHTNSKPGIDHARGIEASLREFWINSRNPVVKQGEDDELTIEQKILVIVAGAVKDQMSLGYNVFSNNCWHFRNRMRRAFSRVFNSGDGFSTVVGAFLSQ